MFTCVACYFITSVGILRKQMDSESSVDVLDNNAPLLKYATTLEKAPGCREIGNGGAIIVMRFIRDPIRE